MNNNTEQSKASGLYIIGKFLLRMLALLLTFVAAVAIILVLSLKMFCSDSFPHVQQTFVTTILETGQLKFLASLFLSSEEIQEIVDQNSMKAFDVEVNTDLIQSGSFGSIDVQTGDTIKVKKASRYTRIIKISQKSFLEILRDKFSSD